MALEGAGAAELFTEVQNAVRATEQQHGIETSVILEAEVNGNAAGSYFHNPEKSHTAASLSKLGVAYVFGDNVMLDITFPGTELIQYQRADDGGEGELDKAELPAELTLEDVVVDMLARSGNTAQRFLVDMSDGPTVINRYLRRFPQTHLEDLGDGRFYCGVTSAQDAVAILRKFREGASYPNEEYDQLVMRSLRATTHRSGLLHEVGELQPGESAATKFGLLDDYDIKSSPHNVRHEVGVFDGEHGRLYIAVLATIPYAKLTKDDQRQLGVNQLPAVEIEENTHAAEELIRTIGSHGARAVGLRMVPSAE